MEGVSHPPCEAAQLSLHGFRVNRVFKEGRKTGGGGTVKREPREEGQGGNRTGREG